MSLRMLHGVAGVTALALASLLSCSDTDQIPCEDDPTCGTFAGLSAEVEIFRDELGVVHVYGETDADVMYGAGYAQAHDRLFQMDLTLRRALGRQAEVLGEDAVDDDETVRFARIEHWAKLSADEVRETDPELFTLLLAWTAGVNRRIEEVRSGAAPLPYGFGPDELDYMPEPWEPHHGLAVGKLILFGNANQIEFEILSTVLQEYFPDAWEKLPLYAPLEEAYALPEDERPPAGAIPLAGAAPGAEAPWVSAPPNESSLPVLPADAAARMSEFFERFDGLRPAASNNWAIHGDHTDNGRPLIAGDPHQGLRSPSLMWANHLNAADAGGQLDVAGFAFVGTPAVQLGHNRHVAWTATTSYADVMDLWAVTIVDGVATVDGKEIPVETRTETIVVRDADPVEVSFDEVPGYGMILPAGFVPLPLKQGRRILWNWPGLAPTQEGRAFLRIDLARDLDELDAAVDSMEIGNFNFIAADANGITYRSSPRVPERPNAALTEPFAVMEGSDTKSFWDGTFHGPDKLPNSRNPAQGYLATANNDPFGFTSDSKLEGDAFYFGVYWDAGTRMQRIDDELQRLMAEGPVTTDALKTLQSDTQSLFAKRARDLLVDAWAEVGSEPALADYEGRDDLDTLVQLLVDWDLAMERDRSAPVVAHALLYFIAVETLSDDLGLVFDAVLSGNSNYVIKLALMTLEERYAAAGDFMQQGKHAILLAALDQTAAFLVERFGSADPSAYVWADYHGTRFRGLWGDELDGGWVPSDGGDGTVNVSGANFFSGGDPRERLESGGGAIYRLVASFDEDGTPRAEINYPRGNHGEPTSPFFDNTLEDWLEDRYQPLLFQRSAIEASAERVVVLAPDSESD